VFLAGRLAEVDFTKRKIIESLDCEKWHEGAPSISTDLAIKFSDKDCHHLSQLSQARAQTFPPPQNFEQSPLAVQSLIGFTESTALKQCGQRFARNGPLIAHWRLLARKCLSLTVHIYTRFAALTSRHTQHLINIEASTLPRTKSGKTKRSRAGTSIANPTRTDHGRPAHGLPRRT
jgi:hypothetical protein